MLRNRILLMPSWTFFWLKNWRDLDFYEQKFQEIQKYHVRKVKCLVRATERKMSVWRMETSDNPSSIGHSTVFHCCGVNWVNSLPRHAVHSHWAIQYNTLPFSWARLSTETIEMANKHIRIAACPFLNSWRSLDMNLVRKFYNWLYFYRERLELTTGYPI